MAGAAGASCCCRGGAGGLQPLRATVPFQLQRRGDGGRAGNGGREGGGGRPPPPLPPVRSRVHGQPRGCGGGKPRVSPAAGLGFRNGSKEPLRGFPAAPPGGLQRPVLVRTAPQCAPAGQRLFAPGPGGWDGVEAEPAWVPAAGGGTQCCARRHLPSSPGPRRQCWD